MVAVAPDANSVDEPGPTPADLEALAAYAVELADGIDRALAPWVERCVERLCEAWSGRVEPDVAAAAVAAGTRARAEVGPRVRALLMLDVDEQRGNPLAVVRAAVRYPTGVLRSAGVSPVVRDATAERLFPDDDYDLTPATFADLDPSLHEVGLAWGAAKAHVVLRRRRAEGRR
jgi:hypothetical protein